MTVCKMRLASTKRLQYADKAPIKSVEGSIEEKTAVVSQFESSIDDFEAEISQCPGSLARWGNRIENTRSCIEQFKEDIKHHHYDFAAYRFNGCPIALMTYGKKDNLKNALFISAIATHPLSENVGGSLIELAVSQSMRFKKTEGKLRLVPLPKTKETYESFGFQCLAAPCQHAMFLDVTQSDKWTTDDQGQWRLARHMKEQFLTGFLSDQEEKLETDTHLAATVNSSSEETFISEQSLLPAETTCEDKVETSTKKTRDELAFKQDSPWLFFQPNNSASQQQLSDESLKAMQAALLSP